MTIDDQPQHVCILCCVVFDGMGHNPEPLASYDAGRACDLCNDTKIIPARLTHLMSNVSPPVVTRVIGDWVMVLHERARDGHRPTTKEMYLESYDADAFDGHGDAAWTADPDMAMRFSSPMEVLTFWRQQSKVKPIRADGAVNRPLTAWTVEPRNLA
jgi:hypothetical protein